MSDHPYRNRPAWTRWRHAVVECDELDPMTEPPFTFGPKTAVVTAGSCFAQHIGRRLAAEGFNYLVTEPAHPMMSPGAAARLGYGIYSALYGNIYTPRQRVQLFDRVYGRFEPREDVWRDGNGAVVDPFRPQIQPQGFNGEKELALDRERHFRAVREAFETLDVFVFTMGLTEAWRSRVDGAVFPLCPGVAGGVFDRKKHEFVNFDVETVVADTRAFLQRLRSVNPSAKVILTVSPVPLMATAEDRHVLVSTVYSKSVLRVACDVLSRERNVTYFPAYEIVASGFGGDYFAEDRRSVTEDGVDHVMRVFSRHFLRQSRSTGVLQRAWALFSEKRATTEQKVATVKRAVGVMCDEEALGRFSDAKKD